MGSFSNVDADFDEVNSLSYKFDQRFRLVRKPIGLNMNAPKKFGATDIRSVRVCEGNPEEPINKPGVSMRKESSDRRPNLLVRNVGQDQISLIDITHSIRNLFY